MFKSVIQSFDDSFKDINNLVYSIHMMPYETLESMGDGGTDMLAAYMMQKKYSGSAALRKAAGLPSCCNDTSVPFSAGTNLSRHGGQYQRPLLPLSGREADH